MKKTSPLVLPNAPTRPGVRGDDEVSRPGDGTDLVIAVAQIMKVERSVANDLLKQVFQDAGQAAEHGWSPGAMLHLHAASLAVVAHQAQITWPNLRGFTAQYLGPYFDAIGRHYDQHAESREVRDATRGYLVGVH